MKKKLLLILLIVFSVILVFACKGPVDPGDGTDIPDGGGGGNGGGELPPGSQDKWSLQNTLSSSSLSTGYLGSSLTMSRDGSTVVAGNGKDAYDSEDPGTGQYVSTPQEYFAASVFRTEDGETWVDYLINDPANDPTGTAFGSSVAASDDGTVVAIGARRGGGTFTNPSTGAQEYLDSGTVYIFTWNGHGYSQSAKLLPPLTADDYPQGNLQFGTSVDLSGDGSVLVVGAPKWDDPAYDSENYNTPEGIREHISIGKVYIFRNSGGNWNSGTGVMGIDFENLATNNHNDGKNFFGFSVSISRDGNRIVAGAYEDPGNGLPGDATYAASAGSVYILNYNGTAWTRGQKILAADRTPNDYFGHSVSISADGGTIAVGAFRADAENTNESGAVYKYTLSEGSWVQTDKLSTNKPTESQQLGFAVSISDVGAIVASGAGMRTGSQQPGVAAIFSRQDDVDFTNLLEVGSDSTAGDYFGHGIAISGDGNLVAVSAPYLDTNAQPGKIYLFR